MSKLSKRKWQAVTNVSNGKWFTGYQGDIKSNPFFVRNWQTKENVEKPALHKLSEEHDVRDLKVKLVGTSRGRSSAIFVFVDEEDYRYNMSISGGEKLLIAYFQDKIERSGEYLVAPFVQTKQGQNYFIEVFAEENFDART